MLTLSPTVTIGGNDVSSYVVEIERQHSICDTMATGRVVLSHAYGTTIDTYDTIVISEQGTKTFTGYVTNVNKERLPVNYYVEFADPAIKLEDFWITQVYKSTGETAEYWIGFFCDLAGVNYQFDVTYGNTVPDDYEWEYSSCMDIIRQLLIVGGFYMYSDPDGVIHFSKQEIGEAPENLSTGDNILSFKRTQTITPTRNKTVVFGVSPIVATATATVAELSSVTKTAVVASPYIETEAYAQELANRMISFFQELGDIKTVDALPNPSWRVGQSIVCTEDWTGYSETCLITSMRVRMGNDGYMMTLILDEFCPFVWGYALAVEATLYAGTDGQGVWRTVDLGISWEDITGDIPSGVSYNVRGISASGTVVWAATEGGVYTTSNGDAAAASVTWTDKTPTLPSGVTATDWTDVEIDPADSNIVYVLMDDLTNSGVYMHKTDDNGSTWSNVLVR